MNSEESQELMLKCIEAEGHVNDFNAPEVVKALRKNRHLWIAAMGTVSGYWLRDVPSGGWHGDMTIYLSCLPENTKAILSLAKKWKADEAEVLEKDERQGFLGAYGNIPEQPEVIRLWWD